MENLMLKAENHMKRGEYEEARKIYNDILLKDPGNAKAYNKLGVICAYEKDTNQAKIYFMKALQLNPHLSSAASNLGNIYFELQDLDKAKTFYEKAIAIDPHNPIPYNNLAVVYKKLNDMENYVKYYKKSVKLSTDISNNLEIRLHSKFSRAYKLVIGILAIGPVLYLLIWLVR